MKYIVTGGAGFIGSHIVDLLISKGHEVIVLDNLSAGKKENLNPKAEFHLADVRKFAEIQPFFKGVDGVFHLAAIPSVPLSIEKPIETHDINVNGTLNVLTAAKEAGVKRLVFSSSCAVYGNRRIPHRENQNPKPNTPYALHKLIGEQCGKLFSELYKLETVNLRYFNVYGPRMPDTGPYSGVIKVFLKQKSAGQPLTITGDGKQSRDFVFVEDVARANLLAMTSKKVGQGESINIGSGKSYSVNEIADLFDSEKVYLPPRLELKHSLADISQAKELLNWEPKTKLTKERILAII